MIHELSAGMDEIKLSIFHFVLAPLFKIKLSKSKELYQLFYDDMVPKYKELALAYLWFGVDATDAIDLSPLLTLFKTNITLEISDGEVMYRKLLVDVSRELAADADKSKNFIQYVISTKKLEGHPTAAKFMPPEEQQQNSNVFLPLLLNLFKEADVQCLIEPPDMSLLVEWLNDCGAKKVARAVTKFKHEDIFRKECKLSKIMDVHVTMNFHFSYCSHGDSDTT